MSEECIHGMTVEHCAMCRPPAGYVPPTSRTGVGGFYGGQSKQDLLTALCEELGIPNEPIGAGSSIPSHVFELLATKTGVSASSMPIIGEAVAQRAGIAWTADCDSRGSVSGGGSTVTADGLRVVLKAYRKLK